RQEQLSTLLAVCYEILGAEDQALLAYEKVIQLNPRNDAALVGRGLLRYTSDPEAAASDFTKAVATNTPLAWPYFYLAHRSLQIGDYRGTLDRCVQALKRANLSTVKADLFEWMAIAQSYLGVAPDSIRANFETALELAPSNERIRRNYKRFVAKLEQAMTPDWEKTYSVTPDEARRMAA
ncbi:MAG TPA: tetratricopeptide repeat protein, partial [Isosphaeraceae bacterium]